MESRKSIVTLANEHVSILEVCRQIGLEVPDDVVLGRSVKIFCPVGDIAHQDGGIDPSFRVYVDTNSGWCFVCSEFYTPVKLYTSVKNVTPAEAAQSLLEIVGYSYTESLDMDEIKSACGLTVEKLPDSASLVEALKFFCARICADWEIRQFDNDIVQVFDRCLALLPRVRTEQDVEQWLKATKKVMQSSLNARD